MTLKAYIIGAAGLTGRELLQLLQNHASVKVCGITSEKHKGQPLEAVFRKLDTAIYKGLEFQSHDEIISSLISKPADQEESIIFLATPNDTSLELAKKCTGAGYRVIDFSGAYRIRDLSEFEEYYKLKHSYPDLNKEAVYGIPELFRNAIRSAKLIANPGCYPTGSILPLSYFWKIKNKLQLPGPLAVSIDAKSGVSGAGGRVEGAGFAFQNVYENFRAYKVLAHQHSPEIRQYALDDFEQSSLPFAFTPHLLPLYRGILSTITIPLAGPCSTSAETIINALREEAGNEPFVRIYESPNDIELKNVQSTNYCDFSVAARNNMVIIVSAIDNLQKGAAGQAVQNMNIMAGFPETESLI